MTVIFPESRGIPTRLTILTDLALAIPAAVLQDTDTPPRWGTRIFRFRERILGLRCLPIACLTITTVGFNRV